jgi:hypothetical protein
VLLMEEGTAEGCRLKGEDVARAAWRASVDGATSGETAMLAVGSWCWCWRRFWA